MRKVTSFFFLVLLMWSCDKNDGGAASKQNSSVDKENILKAELFFKTREVLKIASSQNTNGSSAFSLLGLNKAADWSQAKEFVNNYDIVIEVPVTFEKKQGHVVSSDISKRRTENDIKSLTNLVMIGTGSSDYKYALMTLIPFDESRNNGKLKLEENHYKNISKEFSGLVVFHTWQNKFLNGWVYKNGEIVSSLIKESFTNRNSPQKEVSDYECVQYLVLKWCIDCRDWYTNGVYSNTSCEQPYVCDEFYTNYCGRPGGGGSNPGGFTEVNSISSTFNFKKIDNYLVSPCFMDAFSKIQTSGAMTDIGLLLNENFGVLGQYDLIAKEKQILPKIINGTITPVDGEHVPIANGSIIIINTDLLANASKEYIVSTLMHEIIHGILYKAGKTTEFQSHTEMANYYLESFAASLRTIFPNMGPYQAKALAWAGLQETQAWNNLSSADQYSFRQENQSYRNGNNGQKCN